MTPTTWRRLAIGASLVTFLIAIYFFTFSGYAISRDEWYIFDATESLARRGDLNLNFQFDIYPPTSLTGAKPPPADTEPLQPFLAASLFLIAQALPGVGLAHTVWVFNSLITAFTAGTLYAYGLALGYRSRVAATVALIFGLCTIAWPYSRTFFREPLFAWLTLLSLYLVLRLRRKLTAGEHPLLTLAAFCIVITGALFSKEAGLLIIPAVIIEGLPDRVRRVRPTRRTVLTLLGLVALAGVLGGVMLNADTLFNISTRYNMIRRIQQARSNLSDLSPGITGYLFSPGRSVWLFSPVLLIGIFGWRRLAREQRWQQIIMPLVMLVFFVIGYAAVRGPTQWYGGLGWGPRYLVPLTPVLALWLLPVVQTVLEHGARWWSRLLVGGAVLLSMGVQILGVVVPVHRYYNVLDKYPDIKAWHEGAWRWDLSPLRVTWDLLGNQKLDFAWNYAVGNTWLLPLASGALAILTLISFGWWLRRRNGTCRLSLITAGTLALAAILVIGAGLYAIRLDPRYYGDFQPTRDLLKQLDKELKPDDVIVLNDYIYSEFFMNYYKQKPTVYTLSSSPGERSSADQMPRVESPYPEALIHRSNPIIVNDLATRHNRLWLIINSSPFIPWSVRPMERYLSVHYFPIRAIQGSDVARAVLFDMTPAPPASAPQWPASRVDAHFGESLSLAGYDIPGGTTRQPGEVLPVSLLWEALAPVPQDYNVALYLLSPDGQLVAQHDAPPLNYFDPTQSWRTGSLHRDNHGLALPDDLPPGEYELWAAVYWWQEPANRLPATTASGSSEGDHVVLDTITIQ